MAAITPLRQDAHERRDDDGERCRRLWLVVRRALLMICKEIERTYGDDATKL